MISTSETDTELAILSNYSSSDRPHWRLAYSIPVSKILKLLWLDGPYYFAAYVAYDSYFQWLRIVNANSTVTIHTVVASKIKLFLMIFACKNLRFLRAVNSVGVVESKNSLDTVRTFQKCAFTWSQVKEQMLISHHNIMILHINTTYITFNVDGLYINKSNRIISITYDLYFEKLWIKS